MKNFIVAIVAAVLLIFFSTFFASTPHYAIVLGGIVYVVGLLLHIYFAAKGIDSNAGNAIMLVGAFIIGGITADHYWGGI